MLSPQFTSNFQSFASLLTGQHFNYFCNLLWCVWKARNAHLFQGKPHSPQHIIQNALILQKIQQTQTVNMKETQDIIHIPPLSCIVLVDASWDQNKQVGLANVTYDQSGQLIHFQASSATAESPFHAETMALLQAVKRIIHNPQPDYTTYIFISDCKLLIEAIQGHEEETLPCWHAYRHLHELRLLITPHSSHIRLRFALRQVVKSAHLLANTARTAKLECDGDATNLPHTNSPIELSLDSRLFRFASMGNHAAS